MNHMFSSPDFRDLVVGADSCVPVQGKMIPHINFDNAATTPPLKSVLQEMADFAPNYASVHRGSGYKSRLTSQFYEQTRTEVLNFVNGDRRQDLCIFVRNATEGINILAHCLSQTEKQKKIILSSQMEHHSNDLPWRKYFQVVYVQTDPAGRLDLNDLQSKLQKYRGQIRLVAVTGASNVTGYVNPIHKIAELAHHYETKIFIDGAQLIPHCPLDMKPAHSQRHIDYLAFSAHKMYAPYGTGVLIGPKKSFSAGEPDHVGGGTVNIVTSKLIVWDDPPARDEAGTPNVMGVVALVAAIRTLTALGMRNVEKHERNLLAYVWPKMKKVCDLELYNQYGPEMIGVIPFNIRGIPHQLLAHLLAQERGISVRNGCFCAQPYVQKLLNVTDEQIIHAMKYPQSPRPGMVRISFGIYNQKQEIDEFICILQKIAENKRYYLNKYRDPYKN